MLVNMSASKLVSPVEQHKVMARQYPRCVNEMFLLIAKLLRLQIFI